MSRYGCPYKIDDNLIDRCPIINKIVTDFVMCEADWESCPEYQAKQEEEKSEYEEYLRQLEANETYGELDIIYEVSGTVKGDKNEWMSLHKVG